MFHGLYAAYAATSLSEAVRVSRWIFAVFEMVHLTGLAVLGGAVLIASARLAGWPLGGLDRGAVWRGLRWVALGGLLAVIGSGVVMVGVNPLKYYFNPSFNVKLWLLLAGVALGLAVDRLVRRENVPPIVWRGAGLALSGLFLAVGLAGRAIGLL
ncbi:heme/copper-type cytochrome/quinol oxidase subunit 3 [Novosphingobium sp. SG751A]|uniref:DUF6644 family protein n=1 Tax=Novosphingobium sp. SG751A TaxID=2587000 RepID=UPI001551B1EB|nr:DUF6644 family protein [Novosphingobium sp. SG751A]NOW47442.1 heme/copper-type cytochrome/quinol oxidase subunit 3 [Novosphingobium sp. SG751A]